MKLNRYVIAGFLSIIFLSDAVFADSSVVRIPLKTFTKPAQDLLSDKGHELSIADLTRLFSEGYDLSKLQPVENKYWQNYANRKHSRTKWSNKKLSAVDEGLHKTMPNFDVGVDYDADMGANRELGFYSILVKPSSVKASENTQRYVLTLGQQIHASLLRSALLRKLGYYQESPKYYSKLKLNFESKIEKENFINSAFCETGPSEVAIDCLSITPFKTDKKPNEYLSHIDDKSLYVHGVYLEKMNPEVPSLFDGLVPATGSLIPYFSQSRAYRSLIVPFVIADIGESLNRFSTECATIRDGIAYMSYPFSGYFQDTDHTDVKWALRRVTQLTDQDWDEIIDASKLHPSLKQLVKAKVLLRTKDCIEVFFDEKTDSFYNSITGLFRKPVYQNTQVLFKNTIPNLKYTSDDGYVKDGKVTTEYIPGYPQRFSHGQRTSPFKPGDILKYLKIEAQSAAIGVANNELNKKLLSLKTQSKLDGFKLTDRGYAPFGHTTGRQAGINFSAARLVTTGTFYGSQATVQLVDTISLSVGVGVFNILHDISGFNHFRGVNGFYSRDYTHVHPIESMDETQTIPWKDIIVPSKLKQLASPLKNGQLTEFIQALKPGEVFTITDSFGVNPRLGSTVGLDNLIGFTGKTVPTFSFNANGTGVIVAQTQITRTVNGFQIYIRSQKSGILDFSFDANYFINLLKISNTTNLSDIITQAYDLKYNFDLIGKADKGEIKVDPGSDEEKMLDQQRQFSGKLAGAMRALIFSSDSEKLDAYFQNQKTNIRHNLLTDETKVKLLWLRASKMREGHTMTLRKAKLVNPADSYKTASQTVTLTEYDENGNEIPQTVTDEDQYGSVKNEDLTIATYKIGEMSGRDYLGFGLSVVDGVTSKLLKEYAPQLSKNSGNAANMPYGRAQWHIVRADSELTRQRPGALPSVAVIQNVWGGWSISKKELDSIIQKIQNRFKGTEFENEKFFPDHIFYNVDKIDFFRISENISLLPSAINLIKDLVINPDVHDEHIEKAKFLSRLFQKLSQVGSSHKADPKDKVIFKNLMSLMGAGNEEVGRALYNEQCQKNKASKQHPQQLVSGTWLNGVYYECLDSWVDEIISIARKFPKGSLKKQNQWMAELIYALEKNIPTYVLLKAIGQENYIYYVNVVGFRVGDENADQGAYTSRSLGVPASQHPYSNGLMSVIADKTGLSPIELDKSNASFN